jgi:hypothetical protein
MSPVSHQTIKLSKGKHRAPEDGACVMELASMLAGESFTDRRPPIEAAGTYAVHAIRRHTDETHAAVLTLLGELLEIGARQPELFREREAPVPPEVQAVA